MTLHQPRKGVATRLLALAVRGLIRAYQLVPAYFFRGCCRFEPGCSRYASEAVALHGPVRGTWLAMRRICRCHPWGGLGYDPVPPPAGPVERLVGPATRPRGRLPAAAPGAQRPLEF